jgi:hypothetical protein
MSNDQEANVIRLDGKRPTDDKARKTKELVDSFLARHYDDFRVITDGEGNLSCAEVSSPGVLRPVSDQYVMNKMLLHLVGRANFPDIKNSVFPLWRAFSTKLNGIHNQDIKPLIFKSDTTTPWAWQRLTFDPVDCERPLLLDKMLKRTSAEEGISLVLWLGSLLDYTFPRSQYLYLHGQGNDGKSTLIAMLTKLLGIQGVAMMRSDDFKDSHSTTVLESARLAIFADENSSSFMSSGRFKMVTGDNTMTINPKGAPRRNILLNCKVMVASNYPPSVQGGKADLRRIIPVQLEPIPDTESSHGAGVAFIEQGPAIMQYCYAEFKKWQATNPDKMLPTANEAITEVVANSSQADYDLILDGLFTFEPGSRLPAGELISFLRSQRYTGLEARNIYAAIKRRGAKRGQYIINNIKTWAWAGVSIKGRSTPDIQVTLT